MRSIAALLFVIAVAAPAIAQNEATIPAAGKERKICRTDAPTGSIMPKRSCHTEAEWRAIDDHYHTNVENLDNQRTLREMIPKGS